MFARVKKSGKNRYLQIVESKREGKKVKQRVIATIGRMDVLQAKGNTVKDQLEGTKSVVISNP